MTEKIGGQFKKNSEKNFSKKKFLEKKFGQKILGKKFFKKNSAKSPHPENFDWPAQDPNGGGGTRKPRNL